jgi:diaminopimelate epimerase
MRHFYKLTGSGNDFVFMDWRDRDGDPLPNAERIRAICARGTGVGADGIVFLEPAAGADVAIRYVNSDGSAAALCGNATLCTIRLAARLGIGSSDGVRIETDAGVVCGRLVDDVPEFDVECIEQLTPLVAIERGAGERRIGFAVVGVPHLVVLVDSLRDVDVMTRGRLLRRDRGIGPAGANVNFVAPHPGHTGEWAVRTYERGVEAETLACGTGAVATAALLSAWQLTGGGAVRLWMESGEPLDVRVDRSGPDGLVTASLRGEGRLVYSGELVEGEVGVA